MIETSFPKIQTECLLLKQLEASDWEAISFLRSDEIVNKFVKRPSAETKEKALEFIVKINAGIGDERLYYWKITKKGQNEMIGSICLWNFSEDKSVAEIGYDLHPDHQGQGLMDESLKSVIDFGFRKLNLDAIEAYTHGENKKSKKLLEKNGFHLVVGKTDDHNTDNVVYELKFIKKKL